MGVQLKTLGIDQSLKGTALCLLDDDPGVPPLLKTLIYPDSVVGMVRYDEIVDDVLDAVHTSRPELVVMEDYAMSGGKGTNNLTRLAELGGMIKWHLHHLGYAFGYGTAHNALEEAEAWEATQFASKLFVVQRVNTMKKFCLGDGSTKKDTAYLLKVHDRLHKSFADDNQADAYMHALTARQIWAVIRGEMPVSNLLKEQQECLLDRGRKLHKGLSLAKALKMSDQEKLELIRL